VTINVRAAEPPGVADALGAERRAWLGEIAATRNAAQSEIPLADACGRYLDRYALERGPSAGSG
jgi:hypothetical protein